MRNVVQVLCSLMIYECLNGEGGKDKRMKIREMEREGDGEGGRKGGREEDGGQVVLMNLGQLMLMNVGREDCRE